MILDIIIILVSLLHNIVYLIVNDINEGNGTGSPSTRIWRGKDVTVSTWRECYGEITTDMKCTHVLHDMHT